MLTEALAKQNHAGILKIELAAMERNADINIEKNNKE